MPMHHSTATVTHWTLLSQLEISLLMLVTVLSAAAITFCDSVLAPFLQVGLLPPKPCQMQNSLCLDTYLFRIAGDCFDRHAFVCIRCSLKLASFDVVTTQWKLFFA